MKTTYTFILILFSIITHAQADLEQNLKALGNLSAYSVGVPGFDNRYEGVKGTPLLFDNWQDGKVQFTKQDTFSAPIKFNLELVKQLLLVQLRSGSIGQVTATNIKAIQSEKSNEPNTRWIVLSEKEVEGISSVRLKFYETLHEGKYQLLKSTEKRFKKANYQGAYNLGKEYDEFITETTHWLRGDGKSYTKMKLKRKELEAVLPKQATQLAKEKGLDLNNEKNIIQLLEFLETAER